MSKPNPTTSSYAVLGLLAVAPMTAHALTTQARRNLHWVWPRSERSLYSEPKRLVALGWASAEEQASTGQRGVEYRITTAGRRALRAWLDTSPAQPATDIEAMLRVVFADSGTKTALRHALEVNRDDLIAAVRAQAVDQCRGYLDDGGPYPERLHLIGLFSDFYLRFVQLIDEWTTDALTEIAQWPDVKDVGMTDHARHKFEQVIARYGHDNG